MPANLARLQLMERVRRVDVDVVSRRDARERQPDRLGRLCRQRRERLRGPVNIEDDRISERDLSSGKSLADLVRQASGFLRQIRPGEKRRRPGQFGCYVV